MEKKLSVCLLAIIGPLLDNIWEMASAMHYVMHCTHGSMQPSGFKGGNINCTQQIPVPHVPPHCDHSHGEYFYILNHPYFLADKGTPYWACIL